MLAKLTRDKLPLTAREKRIHACYLLAICSIFLYYYPVQSVRAYLRAIEQDVSAAMAMPVVRAATSTPGLPPEEPIEEPVSSSDQQSLDLLIGTEMEDAVVAIANAAVKHAVPSGLFTGIAAIESGFNSHFYLAYDKDHCHNPWGIKPKGGRRADGSYLRCFDTWDASADYFGELVSTRYFANGLDSVEKIAPMWKCGLRDARKCKGVDNWTAVVYQNGYF